MRTICLLHPEEPPIPDPTFEAKTSMLAEHYWTTGDLTGLLALAFTIGAFVGGLLMRWLDGR